MQTEIENVIRAYKKEIMQEEKLLMSFLKALAVNSAVRHRTKRDLALAVLESRDDQPTRVSGVRANQTSAVQPATQ